MLTGMTGVDASGDRKLWFEPGRYRVRITAVRGQPSRTGDLFYIIETELLEIYQTDVPEKMKVGVHYAHVIKYNTDMGPLNAKRFLLAASGLDPNDKEAQAQITDEIANMSIAADQPFAGLEMQLICEAITTKSGKPFTKHNWLSADSSQFAQNTGQPQQQQYQPPQQQQQYQPPQQQYQPQQQQQQQQQQQYQPPPQQQQQQQQQYQPPQQQQQQHQPYRPPHRGDDIPF